MQIGIVGLPFSGKSTLFQTMTKAHLDESKGHGRDANIATVKVPDKRVDILSEHFNPKKRVYASVEFVDVAGLKKGDRESTQFSTAFLNNVKTNDALIHVVRCFEDPMYPHPEGDIDIARDIRILETEFILTDMEMAEKRIEKLKKQILKIQEEKLKYELHVLEKCLVALEEQQPLRIMELDSHEKFVIRGFQFLSEKPLLAVINLDEDNIGKGEEIAAPLNAEFASAGIVVETFYGKIEMELAQLSEEDAGVFMDDYGIRESALVRIIRDSYNMLDLISFLTFGEDECRAWQLRQGSNAQQAAGEIHTDLMNKFIRAEMVHFEDFVKHGSISTCKEQGCWRLEGREYIVEDGDMLTIRHG